jgi:hypothetical protein
MGFKESAKQQFANLLSQKLLSLSVDGIEDKVFYRPVDAMNPLQAEKLKDYRATGTVAGLADIVRLRARNEDGTKMFNHTDRDDMLKNYGANLLAEIVTKMSEETPDPK